MSKKSRRKRRRQRIAARARTRTKSAVVVKDSPTRVVAIVSGKGGVGKTTFSANLAIALTAIGERTVVIDCNVTTPHLSYYLGVKNYSSTLNNIFNGEFAVDYAPLDQNGVQFIPASEKFTDLENVDMAKLKDIIKDLSKSGKFDFIILDSAPGLGREAMGVLHACNEIIYLTTPTAPNIADIARCDEVARILGHKKFHIVLNKVRGKHFEISAEKAEKLFHMSVAGSIPFDENIMDSTAEGTPILWYNPKSKSCNSFLRVAANLADVSLDEATFGMKKSQAAAVAGGGDVGYMDDYDEDEEVMDSGIEPIVRRRGRSQRKTPGFRSQLRSNIDDRAGGLRDRVKSGFLRALGK